MSSEPKRHWDPMRCVAPFALFVVVLAIEAITPAAGAMASDLLNTAVGAGDTATNGASVAEPLSVSGAQFANPAGLAGFERTTWTFGTGIAYGSGRIEAEVPAGYEPTNEVVPLSPEFALMVRGRGSLRFAMGFHGTVGTTFDYGADPEVGVDEGFFSEIAIVAMPLTVAWRWGEQLWLGAELLPLFGYFRPHFTLPQVPEIGALPMRFKYKLTGPGIQGMLGLTWKPDDRWSVGVSGRPPGIIFMEGSSAVPGMGRQDIELDLEAPAQISLGITRRLGRRLSLSYALRWTDSSVLGDSKIEYEKTPSADSPFVPDAKDEWRHALGVELAVDPSVSLRAGIAHAGHIVGDRGVSPLSYDGDDTRLSFGAGLRRGSWMIDFGVMYKFRDTRSIQSDEALLLPGRYISKDAAIVLLSASREFGAN